MGEVRRIDEAGVAAELSGETPMLRLFSLLELIASKDQLFTLQELVEKTRMAQSTLHRMLQQLEGAGLLIRENNGRNYRIGARLRRMAEGLLLNDTHHGARHVVLRDLVDELGESCNLTTLSGNEILYLDRVETPEPLRFTLQPGSRVPAHCSASGKIIMSQLAPAQRRRLLEAAPLKQYTPNTVTDVDRIEEELKQVRRDGYAIDAEEFLPGLVCAAVLVPSASGISNLGIAVQAPVMRLTPDRALRLLPALRRAADAIGEIEAEVAAGESTQESS